MKSKLPIYFLPVLLVVFLVYGYSTQDDPRYDAAPRSSDVNYNNPAGLDTNTPANFPYPELWNFNYSADPGPAGGTVGACYFQGKHFLNSWNSANLYKYNPDGPNGGPGTQSNINPAYNGGLGTIRDMTIAPDGSGTNYLWGGAAGTTLYKLDSAGTRIASYIHAGAAYRAIAWDPNRKGFWSCNFSDNIVCRDTNGVVIKTLVNTLAGKYGMGFDSTSTADSAFLWVWNQSSVVGGDNELHRIYINTNTDTRTYLFPLVGGTLGIAGGAEVFVENNMLVLSLNFQNFAMLGYKLKDLTPPGGGSITVNRNGLNISIPDNGGNANPAVDSIVITGIPAGNEIKKIQVTIDTVIHTYIGDLRFWLNHTPTAFDTIISRIGYTGTGFGNSCDNLTGTVLLDTVGPINIQNIPSTCNGVLAQATGTFNPKAPLAPYQNSGTNPNGSYILRISDNAAADVGNLRAWSIKIDYGTIVGVSNNVTSIADNYKLSQNYPNPFNPSTKIDYSIPKSGLVSIKVYDVLGKEVYTLVNEIKNAGSYEAVFNGANFSSGVYFYRIQAGNFVETKKMYLLK